MPTNCLNMFALFLLLVQPYEEKDNCSRRTKQRHRKEPKNSQPTSDRSPRWPSQQSTNESLFQANWKRMSRPKISGEAKRNSWERVLGTCCHCWVTPWNNGGKDMAKKASLHYSGSILTCQFSISLWTLITSFLWFGAFFIRAPEPHKNYFISGDTRISQIPNHFWNIIFPKIVCWESNTLKRLEKMAPDSDEDPSYKLLKILNMASTYFRKQEMAIWYIFETLKPRNFEAKKPRNQKNQEESGKPMRELFK